jgi:two-component system sensor histidine kinase RegB
MTLMLAGFAIACATLLMFWHNPLPWAPSEEAQELPQHYVVGIWVALLLCIGYISVYAWQVLEESRQLASSASMRGRSSRSRASSPRRWRRPRSCSRASST